VLRIDVQGALTIRTLFPDAVLIFVEPPSAEEQERRLRSRETENEADLQIRLQASEWEMAQISSFDYRVVNDDLNEAVDLVRCIIRAEHARVKPRKGEGVKG
jgi:guanylate kinase